MAGLTHGMSAVVFDFFGTLTPVSPSEAWASNAARLAAVLGVSVGPLLEVLDDSFPERACGALGDVRQTMQALADRLGVRLTEEQLDEATATRRSVQESMFTLRPEALGVIEALRSAGLKTGLVSDCTSELPDAWARLPLAAVIDAPVFSCVEGTRKPDPRLFRKVAADLETEPARCVYVGDGGGQELTGSSAIGMRAVLLAGPDWHAHGDRRREAGWTGRRIGSLTELWP
ncbi:MAG TPA: HAD family hydrolase [Streptosporangiaceae bacterium]|nr:HAD family hydrolase [Streptosporangiaceae bacterium]